MEKGHKADENQVSKTSSSCSSVNLRPAANFSALAVASSAVLPTTQLSGFADYTDFKLIGIGVSLKTYVWARFSFNANKICRASMTPPKLPRNTPVLDSVEPAVPLCL
jgi:hypothetical protein